MSGVPFEVDTAKFDLSLTLREGIGEDGAPTGMSAEFSYASALFDHGTVERFARRFELLLAGILADPQAPVGDLPMLDVDEVRRLTHVHGDHVGAGGTLADILTAAVTLDPNATAVRYEGRSISYRELDETSSKLARILIGRGVGPEDIVAVSYPRSYEMVLSVWAIAKQVPRTCRSTPPIPSTACGTCSPIPVRSWVSRPRPTAMGCPVTPSGSCSTIRRS